MELQLKLSQFEGPLDLLLHLLERDKIDIKDIFVSDITEQYLNYVADLSQLDMENASEFLTVAAHLLEIKSRSLLPKPVPLEEGEEDPEQALIRRLTEYKLYKEAGEKLHDMEEENLKAYYKLPEEMHLQERIELEDMKLDALIRIEKSEPVNLNLHRTKNGFKLALIRIFNVEIFENTVIQGVNRLFCINAVY